MSHHHSDIAHDLECGSAAYAALIERAEDRGDRKLANGLRREWRDYQARSLAILHDDVQEAK